MPLALLLSPDDQAVSAITAVLEEMSVACERPLDGASAAQKINSHTFDLVLVDCENLPAAKLIFDVCRRGKGGKNPVPIAIVDGRAGLPTAFRLGAEQILTKPVAKDQARNTIRAAVSRVKKEEPVRASGSADQINALETGALQPDAGQNHESSIEPDSPVVPQEQAVAASAGAAGSAASTQITSSFDPAATLSAPALTATASVPVAVPQLTASGAGEVPAIAAESKDFAPEKPFGDPVLAEPEKAEAEAKVESAESSSKPQGENKQDEGKQGKGKQAPKTYGLRVALLVLLLTCAGFYVAWMYEPGFQALAQSQIDRVLVLAGVARQPQAVHIPTPVKPAAQPAKALRPANSADSAQPSGVATTSPAAATTPSTTAGVAVAASSGASATAVPQPASTSPNAAGPAAPKSDLSTTIGGKTVANQNIAQSTSDVAVSSDGELPGEKTAIILSSKGADNRLMHSVQPTYPVGTRPAGTEGTMVLKAVIDENGKVTGARVVEGNRALANAAISAVKQWRYRPYVRDGKALSFQTVVLVDFQRP